MNLEPFIAVSGQAALFKMVTSKSSGLVLENLDSGKTSFFSMRKHEFTPLGTVAVYTLGSTTPLVEVFQSMLDKKVDHPVVSHKAEKHAVEEYFEIALPDYDEDRVSFSDMKKIVKWFSFLDSRGLLKAADSEEE